MFKKTKIAAVTAAVLGMSAFGAMAAAPTSLTVGGSTGQVLIFPYYNVNNGFSTAFNITNTTGDYKAVKLRFRESKTSNDMLDFNVYMSPQDVFTMTLTQTAGGGVIMQTTDTTCTYPALPVTDANATPKVMGKAFIGDTVYNSVKPADVREGYLEVIEMGIVDPTAVVGGTGKLKAKTIASQIKHSSGKPVNCQAIADAWAAGTFVQGGATADPTWGTKNGSTAGFYGAKPVVATGAVGAILPPTGGLAGSSILIDTVNVAGFVAEPTVVDGYSQVAQHYKSSDTSFYLLPSLASGSTLVVSALGDLGSTVVSNTWTTVNRDFGLDDPSLKPNTAVPSGVNPMPMANALLVGTLANQYFVAGQTSTDWVVSTPMRKHGIYNGYTYTAGAASTATGSTDIKVSATRYWKLDQTKDINSKFTYYDREEAFTTPAAGDFSPPIQSNTPNTPFKSEVNILALTAGGANNSVLGSANAQTLTLASGFVTGWGMFDFSAYDLRAPRYVANWVTAPAALAPGVMQTVGAPVAGFAAARGTVNGQNLGEAFPMVTTVTRGN